MKNTSRNSGFTLIELMVTVVIIGILAAIVVPNYTEYVRQSALSEAFANLSDLRVRLEQFYQSNRNYGPIGGTCGDDGTAVRVSTTYSGSKFTYSCTLGGTTANPTYLLTATGNAGTSAAGHIFTLDTSNTKKTTKFKNVVVDKACWLRKGSEC